MIKISVGKFSILGMYSCVYSDCIIHSCSYRSGNEEKLMSLLTPLNVNCHASDGRKVCIGLLDFA